MKIYLIRHASALDALVDSDDTVREITDEGVKDAKKTAEVLQRIAGKPDAVISSPLTRAVQTARVIAKKTRFKHEIMLFDGLKPDATPDAAVEFILANEDFDKVFIIGHQPLLGKILARITGFGKSFDIAKCGVYCVNAQCSDGVLQGVIEGYITPALVRKLI